jgi:glycosyltransferase involved in cell wall biosynthesis
LKLSIIVPMLNEEAAIAATLEAIRLGAPLAEIVVADGGSSDRSAEIARPRCDKLIESPRGRARQMNAAASLASGDAFAFVHADTIVPPTFARDIEGALADRRVVGGRFDVAFDLREPALADRRVVGGRFDVAFDLREPALAIRGRALDDAACDLRRRALDIRGRALDVVAAMISLRSRVARSATGDQAIFVRREVFERLGGYAEIELCEDVDFARRMRRTGRVACLRARVITSSRRWRRDGIVRTIVKMWVIKTLFLAGVSPTWLKRHYADTR